MKDAHNYNIKIDNASEVALSEADLGNTRILELNDHEILFIENNTIIRAKIIEFDPSSKSYILKVNGRTIHLILQNALDLKIEQMGLNAHAHDHLKVVEAPMPGLVLSIEVAEGDTVNKGDNLLTLEAMKMENIIKAAGDGTIGKIHVHVNDKVDKGQLLISF